MRSSKQIFVRCFYIVIVIALVPFLYQFKSLGTNPLTSSKASVASMASLKSKVVPIDIQTPTSTVGLAPTSASTVAEKQRPEFTTAPKLASRHRPTFMSMRGSEFASNARTKAAISGTDAIATDSDDFAQSFQQVKRQQRHQYLYTFGATANLPLLRVSQADTDAARRVREASAWLRTSVDVVFAVTVRNAIRGLPSTADQMMQLAKLFRNATFVFVENDSSDKTRDFLVDWRRRDPRVRLLGCGDSDAPCRLNVSYSTGRLHRQGWSQKRSDTERVERGVLMSALRNIYLTHIYKHLARPDTLLIVLDADLSFRPWNLDAILQGLYYFRDRPGLQSLCAHTRFRESVYDPCTLNFYPSYHFSQSPESQILANFRTQATTGLPPVKVDSCFQAFTTYRLSHLAQNRLMYGPAEGETVCEHNTLARQLRENYLDFNMRFDIVAQNEGGI